MSKFSKAWPESAWPQHQPLDTLNVHDLAELRKIIAEVIDEDGPSNQGGRCDRHNHEWDFGIGDDRKQFIEAVIAKVITTALQRKETTNANVARH